jgi:hypothetical protein
MPDVKVYIRADDLDKWNSIEKKSEFIHNALNAKAEPNDALNEKLKRAVDSDGTLRVKSTDTFSGPLFRDKKKSKL